MEVHSLMTLEFYVLRGRDTVEDRRNSVPGMGLACSGLGQSNAIKVHMFYRRHADGIGNKMSGQVISSM